jgi:uncharacterized damage-inducible protein DinB
MISPHYCRVFASYNHWFNEKLYAACDALGTDARTQEAGAFFHSIQGTLQHLIWGDLYWCRTLKIDISDFDGNQDAFDEGITADWRAMKQARLQIDDALIAWAATITQEFLDADASYTGANGVVRELTQALWVTQMFNHQTHHRGQVTTLLSQRGIDVGATDIYHAPGAILMRPVVYE